MSDTLKEYPCPGCPEVFPSLRSRASHAKVHQKGVTCQVCGVEVRYLAAHVKREHSDDPLIKLETGLSDVIAEVRTLRREVEALKITSRD